ncbi:MAG: hypothetical protein AB7R89_09095 [Dehalococcoidia bacterium]
MREITFFGAARRYYAQMSDAERATLDLCLRRLERDPAPDGVTTFSIPGIPDFFLYDDGAWRMAYTVPDAVTVIIRSIAHALDLPA